MRGKVSAESKRTCTLLLISRVFLAAICVPYLLLLIYLFEDIELSVRMILFLAAVLAFLSSLIFFTKNPVFLTGIAFAAGIFFIPPVHLGWIATNIFLGISFFLAIAGRISSKKRAGVDEKKIQGPTV